MIHFNLGGQRAGKLRKLDMTKWAIFQCSMETKTLLEVIKGLKLHGLSLRLQLRGLKLLLKWNMRREMSGLSLVKPCKIQLSYLAAKML